mgnify:CR=1 FL=1
MEQYVKYKEWWLDTNVHTCDEEAEEEFAKHINSLTTYELFETLSNWS